MFFRGLHMTSYYIRAASVALFLLMLPGCFPKYYKRRLPVLTKETADFYAEKNGVMVAIKQFSPEEKKHIFNNRLSHKIHAVQCCIVNRSSIPYAVDWTQLPLNQLTPQQVFEMMRFDPSRFIAGAVIGGVLVPAGALIGLIAAAHNAAAGPALLAFYPYFLFATFMVPVFVLLVAGISLTVWYGIKVVKDAREANIYLLDDIYEKMGKDKEYIKPQHRLNKVFFVADRIMPHNFELPLYSMQGAQAMIFPIALK